MVDQVGDARPHQTLLGVGGAARFAADAHHHADRRAGHRALGPAEEDHRRRAVAGDVGTAGVDHVRHVVARHPVLDQLLAELPLHERVRRDHPDEPRPLGDTRVRQAPELFGERHAERVLAMARREALAVQGVQGGVLHHDVRRVPHHRTPRAAQQRLHLLDVLEGVAVAAGIEHVEVGRQLAVQQRIAHEHVDREARRALQRRVPRSPQRRDEQAEAGDVGGERVEVDPADRLQRPLHMESRTRTGLQLLPARQQAIEGAEQEVARTARRVDQGGVLQPEGLDGRGEGAIEDELLHEHGRLQQCERLLRVLREVLVQVAEEPGAPRGVGELVADLTRLRIEFLQLAQQAAGAVGRGRERHPHRVVFTEHVTGGGQIGEVAKDMTQPVAIIVGRVGLHVGRPLLDGERPAVAGTGDERLGHQTVVLAEPHDHATEHPRHGDLGEEALGPRRLGERRATGPRRLLVLGIDQRLACRIGLGVGAQILDQLLHQPFGVGEQSGGIDHEKTPRDGEGEADVGEPHRRIHQRRRWRGQ